MSRKKVLIVTLQDNLNFGNRLQNYALQQVLEQEGLEADNLDVRERVQKSFLNDLKTVVKIFLARLGNERFQEYLARSIHNKGGKRFTSEYIHGVIRVSRYSLSGMDWDRYDTVFAGSDQVWHNWDLIPDELPYFYLQFVPEDKRVSYAASFGFHEFPKEDEQIHKDGLNSMRAISCREQEGCELVKKLTGRDSVRVLDPTLLPSKDTWDQLQKKPSFEVDGAYLLVFFLGDIIEGYREEIDRLSRDRNIKIININDIHDRKHFIDSPNEFLWLIRNADTVCTDSFHASVFAIMYNRNLRAYPRTDSRYKVESMFGRLTELLSSLGLSQNAYGYGGRLDTGLTEEAVRLLDEQRESSLDFIRKQTGGADGRQ